MRGEKPFRDKIPHIKQLIFIGHFLHFTKEELEKMTFDEINDWFDEAYNLFKIMNPPIEK